MEYPTHTAAFSEAFNQLPPAWLEVKRSKKFPCSAKRQLVSDAAAAAKAFSFLRELVHEEIHVCALDAKNKILHIAKVSQGGPVGTSCMAADIFRIPLVIGACHVVMAHNHPSGDSRPSAEDILFTKKVKEIGDILGIRLLDHIIIGDNYSSFVDLGHM